MKLMLNTILTFIAIGLGFLPAAWSQQNSTARTFYVNPIKISGLAGYRGSYLTIYYALGSRGALSSEEDQITLREVKEKRSFQISGDSVIVPEINLKRSNLFITYNILILVVHSVPNFTWLNGNKSLPAGEKYSANINALDVDSLTKLEFESLVVTQDSASGVPLLYQFKSRNSVIGN
jgi:hypothetical protein